MSTKGLTKDLVNKYSILNSVKCVSSDGLQDYLELISTIHIYWVSKIELWEYAGKVLFHKKVLKICILQTLVLLQSLLVIINIKKWNLKESV